MIKNQRTRIDSESPPLSPDRVNLLKCDETSSIVYWDPVLSEYNKDACTFCEKLNTDQKKILIDVVRTLNCTFASNKSKLKRYLPPMLGLLTLMLTVLILGALTFDGIFLIVSYAVCGTLTVLGIAILALVIVQLFRKKRNKHDEISKVVYRIGETLKGTNVHLKLNALANSVSVVWGPKNIAKLTCKKEAFSTGNFQEMNKIRLLPRKMII